MHPMRSGSKPSRNWADLVDRIVAIRTIRWSEQPNCLWLEIETESGIVGLGETFYHPAAVEDIIHDMAWPLLNGRDAGQITMHARDLFACANFSGYAGTEMRAFSAIDIALWDALGQVTGLPIHGLLGGHVRDRVAVYNTCVDAGTYQDATRSLNDPVGLVQDLLDQGIRALKIYPWDRFAPQLTASHVTGPAGWSAMGPAGSYISAREVAEGLAVVDAIRHAFGDAVEIIIEGHSRWDVNAALRILRALEPYDVLWVEDIIQPDSVDDLRRLAQETSVPQAVSERLIGRFRYREVLERQAAHVIMLDAAWTGGISESSRIADLADAYHLPFAPHDCTGPVTALVNLHLAFAKANAMTTEMVRGFVEGYYRDVLDRPLPIESGFATVPEGPGLGASLREDFRARNQVTTRQSSA